MNSPKMVFDASSLIAASESCLINMYKRLSESAEVEFIIPESVFYESVARPLEIKRFELNAVRINKAIDDGWLKIVKPDYELKKLTHNVLELSNQIFKTKKGALKIIHLGEAEAFALVKKFSASTLVIDERTARMIVEDPVRLAEYISFKYGEKVSLDSSKLNEFKKFLCDFKIIRSVDLIALAFERNLFGEDLDLSKQSLEAALYAVKFAGCAVSLNEIDDYLKSVV